MLTRDPGNRESASGRAGLRHRLFGRVECVLKDLVVRHRLASLGEGRVALSAEGVTGLGDLAFVDRNSLLSEDDSMRLSIEPAQQNGRKA